MGGNFSNGMIYRILIVLVLISVISCKGSKEPFTKRIISNSDYKEHFYITDNDPNSKSSKTYYWFKSQKVHSSQGDYGGELLDGAYLKYYYTNQLAEKGKFTNGIKSGAWKSWYKNGQLATTENWNNGRLSGKYVFYDSIGNIISRGNYKNGLRSGSWIYPIKGDTIIYKKGLKVKKVKKVRDSSYTNIFSKIFGKKNDSITNSKNKKRTQKSSSTKSSTKGKSTSKKKKKQTKRKEFGKEPNFFQRLFGKKEKG